MNVLQAAHDEIKALADGIRESGCVAGRYTGDAETTAEIQRLEQLAAALYAVILTMGVE